MHVAQGGNINDGVIIWVIPLIVDPDLLNVTLYVDNTGGMFMCFFCCLFGGFR